MKKCTLLLLILFSTCCFSQVVINEIDTDTPSTDVKEFIELKSITPNYALDGYVLVFFNGASGAGKLSYFALDLDGLTTNSNGLVTIGNKAVSPVPSRYINDSAIQNGPDGVALYKGNGSNFPSGTIATTSNLIDAIVYSTISSQANDLMTALGLTIQINENQNLQKDTQSIQRKSNGDYEVKEPTPNANNDGTGIVFNGINIVLNTLIVDEGQYLTINFTTQNVVTTSDLIFSFSLNYGTFDQNDFTGNLNVTIPIAQNSFSKQILINDDLLDEGDEVLSIKIGAIPSNYVKLSDEIQVRIIDNDFKIAAWGSPLTPTFGIVENTKPIGYYDTLEGKSGAELKKAIQDIIANPNVVRAQNYGDIEEILKQADQNPLNSNEVWLMYVEQGRSKYKFQNTASNTGLWNREHIYPQSRGGFSDGTSSTPDGIDNWQTTSADDINAGHADAHALRAEDGPENSSRNNSDYGLDDYNGPSGNKGSWKGDVARAIFYMVCRYNALDVVIGNLPDSTVGKIGDLSSLLTWNKIDSSDDFEMNRNNIIYLWQHNRNPFIDYPELADYIWGEKVGLAWHSSLTNNTFSKSTINVFYNNMNQNLYVSGIINASKIDLFSISGQNIYSTILNENNLIPLHFESGIYLVKISNNNEIVNYKIFIN